MQLTIEASVLEEGVEISVRTLGESSSSKVKLTPEGRPAIFYRSLFSELTMEVLRSLTRIVSTLSESIAKDFSGLNISRNEILSPAAVALARTVSLMKRLLGDDDGLAEMLFDTEHHTLAELRKFFEILAENKADFVMCYDGEKVEVNNARQIKNILDFLSEENANKIEENLLGAFVGVLPHSRIFEFKMADSGKIIKGKLTDLIQNPREINHHLHSKVQITVNRIELSDERTWYFLNKTPDWN